MRLSSYRILWKGLKFVHVMFHPHPHQDRQQTRACRRARLTKLTAFHVEDENAVHLKMKELCIAKLSDLQSQADETELPISVVEARVCVNETLGSTFPLRYAAHERFSSDLRTRFELYDSATARHPFAGSSLPPLTRHKMYFCRLSSKRSGFF